MSKKFVKLVCVLIHKPRSESTTEFWIHQEFNKLDNFIEDLGFGRLGNKKELVDMTAIKNKMSKYNLRITTASSFAKLLEI